MNQIKTSLVTITRIALSITLFVTGAWLTFFVFVIALGVGLLTKLKSKQPFSHNQTAERHRNKILVIDGEYQVVSTH